MLCKRFFTLKAGIYSFLLFALLTCFGLADDNVIVFSHAPTGGGVGSSFTFINTNFETAATGTLSFYNQDGTRRTVMRLSGESGNQFQINVPAGGTVVFEISGDPALALGLAILTSDIPIGGIYRFTFLDAHVGILGTTPETSTTLHALTADTNRTGVGIGNPLDEPINLEIVHFDAAGNEVESVSPPELNPLPPKGQYAKFLNEVGFSQIGDQSEASVLIRSKDDKGKFTVAALVLKGGVLSTTGTLRGGKGTLNYLQLHGSYEGTRVNETFSSQNPISIFVGIVAAAEKAMVTIELPGVVFAVADRPPVTLYGELESDNTFRASGTTEIFGPTELVLEPNGDFVFSSDDVPGQLVDRYRLEGKILPESVQGDFTITFPGGDTAVGNIDLRRTGS